MWFPSIPKRCTAIELPSCQTNHFSNYTLSTLAIELLDLVLLMILILLGSNMSNSSLTMYSTVGH
jgi:hypothetical protein